jgi:phage/plasmid-like protein (TIGR03299 family)
MSHEIETAIYSQREGAGWTGLGQVIPHDIAKDPRKMAELVGATYQVVKRECFYKTIQGDFRAVQGREVLVRDDTGAMLEVVSDSRYHVENRQPEHMLESFRDELAKNNMEISHAAVLDGGRKIAVCAMFPKDFDIDVGGKGDIVERYVTGSTGYNKKDGTRYMLGGTRVVCNNTLQMAIAEATEQGTLRTLRASTLLQADSLVKLLASTMTTMENERATFDALANQEMTAVDVSRFFANVLEINIADLGKFKADGSKLISTKSQNMLKELADAYSNAPGAAIATGTAWGALNAVTYYATHIKTCRDTSGSGENAARVASNLNGDAAKLKMRALELAAQSLAIAA